MAITGLLFHFIQVNRRNYVHIEKIQDSIATRDLIFENDYTNTIDVCFDDSELLSHTNFSFVKIDSKYDCKIFLFGKEDNKGELFGLLIQSLLELGYWQKLKMSGMIFITFHFMRNLKQLERYVIYIAVKISFK